MPQETIPSKEEWISQIMQDSEMWYILDQLIVWDETVIRRILERYLLS